MDTAHTRVLLDKHGLGAVCSLGLPEENWASINPDGAIEHLIDTLNTAAAIGAEEVSGVTFSGTRERTGLSPTQAENDNVERAFEVALKHAKGPKLSFGVDPVIGITNRSDSVIKGVARRIFDRCQHGLSASNRAVFLNRGKKVSCG